MFNKKSFKQVLSRKKSYGQRVHRGISGSVRSIKDHYSNNPEQLKGDIIMGALGLLLLDMESDMDTITDNTTVSAYADYQDLQS